MAWLFLGLCLFLGFVLDLLCCLYDDEEIAYEHLSEERRLDLDNLQSRAIFHQLNRFTLTVSVQNMLKRQTDSDTTSSSTGDETSSTGDDSVGNDNREQSNNDVEKGMVHAENNSVDGDTTYAGNKDYSEYSCYVNVTWACHYRW